jgi:hypothetical protein
MMFVPHRKHAYGPPRPVMGTALLYFTLLYFTLLTSLNLSNIYDAEANERLLLRFFNLSLGRLFRSKWPLRCSSSGPFMEPKTHHKVHIGKP